MGGAQWRAPGREEAMERGETISTVQGLRFLVALAVALTHGEIVAFWTGRQLGHALERWTFPGAAGVDLFFSFPVSS